VNCLAAWLPRPGNGFAAGFGAPPTAFPFPLTGLGGGDTCKGGVALENTSAESPQKSKSWAPDGLLLLVDPPNKSTAAEVDGAALLLPAATDEDKADVDPPRKSNKSSLEGVFLTAAAWGSSHNGAGSLFTASLPFVMAVVLVVDEPPQTSSTPQVSITGAADGATTSAFAAARFSAGAAEEDATGALHKKNERQKNHEYMHICLLGRGGRGMGNSRLT